MTAIWVLVVEDQADILRFVRMALEKEGLSIAEAQTVQEARIESACRRPDLVILDLGLPDGDGKTFIQELRVWSSVPVVFLCAREQESEKVAALDAGADDYLTKPFGMPELLSRVRAQLRRASLQGLNGQTSPIVQFGKIRVDLGSHEVTKSGEVVHPTPIEFRLLTALIRGQGRSSLAGNDCVRFGDPAMRNACIISRFIWITCVRSSKMSRRVLGISSPSCRSVTGFPAWRNVFIRRISC